MYNLAVDIGNSAVKYALFEADTFIRFGQVPEETALLQLAEFSAVTNIIFSSVRATESILLSQVPAGKKVLKLNWQLPVPITNHYETPQTLGMDRLAAVVGANFLYPDRDILVLDAGTCITCDYIDKNKNYQGGSITLGLDMKFRALHTFTQKLPLIEQKAAQVPLTGRNTADAIRSGVMHGTVAELNGIIQAYRVQSPDLVVVLCGGDAAFFETNLKATIFVVPELVLIGLNRILNYNE